MKRGESMHYKMMFYCWVKLSEFMDKMTFLICIATKYYRQIVRIFGRKGGEDVFLVSKIFCLGGLFLLFWNQYIFDLNSSFEYVVEIVF
jgi:hypothetical protein